MVPRPADPSSGAFRRFLAARLPIAGDAVDLGTGTGRIALDVAPSARSVVGVDVDAGPLEAARWDAKRRGIANARFVLADAERADLRSLNDGNPFALATARLFLSIELVGRASDALERGGHFVVEALEAGHWREAGGSRFNLAPQAVLQALAGGGFEVVEAVIERTEHRFVDARAGEAHLKERRLWTKWKADGRWDTLRSTLRRGGTLTESHLVFCARRT